MVLKTVFALASPLLIGAVALAMFVMASYEISSRQERRFAGAWGYGIGAGTTMLATLLVHGLCAARHAATGSMVRTRGTDTLARDHPRQRHERGQRHPQRAQYVDYARAAGHRSPPRSRADRYAALKPLQRGALRSGMIPVINQMSAAGVITLPGIMTGQILAGMDAVEAAKYQILLCFCSPARRIGRAGGQSTSPPGRNHRRARPFAARSAGAQ